MNIEHVCMQSCQIIKETATFLKKELGKVSAQEIEFKERNHLVSYVDKTAEKILIEKLGQLLPDASFLAEEETVKHVYKDWQWIIDPLDGTTNFLHHLPFFAISVALQHEGKTILGIVHSIMQDETFYSYGANKSFLNKKIIKVSSTNTIQESLLATGFPYYDFDYIESYLKMLKPLILETRGVRRIGSAALDLAYVACGRFDGYFEYSLSPWDVAGGAFIVQNAGGMVGDFIGGDNYIYGREIVAGNPTIYRHLVDSTIKNFK